MGGREAILEGTLAAQRLHAELGTRKAFQNGEKSHIDVCEVAARLGATVLFRPLDGLLGAYFGQPAVPLPGILVSTKRDLHVQRFTVAHELGHLYLGHTPSLDEQVGLWRGDSRDLQEVAADAFASEFLFPRWLYIHHAGRHRWDASALRSADTVYQLSLRLGASYEATCWGLRGHGIIAPELADKLQENEPKALKMAALDGRAKLTNPWADVWVINETDDGLAFEGGLDDIIIFRCRERASAGFLWDEHALQQQGFDLLVDAREETRHGECGAEVTRVLVARVNESREYLASMTERRPWRSDDHVAKLTISFDLQGKEQGLPRSARKFKEAA